MSVDRVPYADRRHIRGTRRYIQGATYHLRTSTIKRLPLLADPRCKRMVIEAIKRATEALEFDLIAYVIMPEHAHMVVRQNGTRTVSDLMAYFKKRTARLINQHLGRSGPFWRGDFFDHILRDDEHLDELVRYIHDNPVRRGLASKADEWEFSSWRQLYGE